MIDLIKKSVKFIAYDFLELSSTRIKLIYMTFFSCIGGIFWFGMVVPVVREISRTNGNTINLDSPYAGTIIGTLSTFFMATVVSYVSSNWSLYKAQGEKDNSNNPAQNNPMEDKMEPKKPCGC